MDTNAILDLIQSVGVPLAFALVFFFYWQKDREKWATIIENNTKAIENLILQIKKGE